MQPALSHQLGGLGSAVSSPSGAWGTEHTWLLYINRISQDQSLL